MIDESSPIAMPMASTPGRSRAVPPAITPGGVTSTPAITMAITSPDVPGKRRPVAALSRM